MLMFVLEVLLLLIAECWPLMVMNDCCRWPWLPSWTRVDWMSWHQAHAYRLNHQVKLNYSTGWETMLSRRRSRRTATDMAYCRSLSHSIQLDLNLNRSWLRAMIGELNFDKVSKIMETQKHLITRACSAASDQCQSAVVMHAVQQHTTNIELQNMLLNWQFWILMKK